jgi:serine protease Do/serine protease DegQ
MERARKESTVGSISTVAGALVALLAFTNPAWAALPTTDEAGAPVPTLAPMVKRVSPAIVNISASGTVDVRRQNPLLDDPFFRKFFQIPDEELKRPTQSLGSGVIIDAAKGLILTNHHVVEGADKIQVTLLDNRQVTAEVIGSDEGSDVAVLKIPADHLSQIELGDSDALEVGDFVVAIGNPFGFSHTVTSGIVSALGRHGLNPEGYEDFIQTDASINPGNSGGALINLRGQLVGINSAIISGSGGNIGIGFAIPINMARAVMTQLVQYGEVRRGQLGVQILDVTPQIAEASGLTVNDGALVSQVVPGSPAEHAGIQTGDVIVGVNGTAVKGASELRNKIGLLPLDQPVDIDVIREGQHKTFHTKLVSKPAATEPVRAADIHSGLEGAEFENVGPGEEVQGVRVRDVAPDSPAAQRGLEPGDIILRVNRKPVTTVDELREATADQKSLLLRIRRGNGELLLPIQ